jgi:hypothetical protein
MGFALQYTNATWPTFVMQVTTAIVNAAIAISSEAPATANHVNRVAYAKLVLNDPNSYAPRFALGVAANLALDVITTVTDTQVSNNISALWNGFAGVA